MDVEISKNDYLCKMVRKRKAAIKIFNEEISKGTADDDNRRDIK